MNVMRMEPFGFVPLFMPLVLLTLFSIYFSLKYTALLNRKTTAISFIMHKISKKQRLKAFKKFDIKSYKAALNHYSKIRIIIVFIFK